MSGKDILTGLIDLGVGAATGNVVSEKLDGGLTGLLGGAIVGSVAAGLTNELVKKVNDETGIIDDVGGLIDDVFDLF